MPLLNLFSPDYGTPSKTIQNQLPMTPKTRKGKSYIANEQKTSLQQQLIKVWKIK